MSKAQLQRHSYTVRRALECALAAETKSPRVGELQPLELDLDDSFHELFALSQTIGQPARGVRDVVYAIQDITDSPVHRPWAETYLGELVRWDVDQERLLLHQLCRRFRLRPDAHELPFVVTIGHFVRLL